MHQGPGGDSPGNSAVVKRNKYVKFLQRLSVHHSKIGPSNPNWPWNLILAILSLIEGMEGWKGELILLFFLFTFSMFPQQNSRKAEKSWKKKSTKKNLKIRDYQEFPGGPVVWIPCFHCPCVQSPVWELRSHKPWNITKRKKKIRDYQQQVWKYEVLERWRFNFIGFDSVNQTNYALAV